VLVFPDGLCCRCRATEYARALELHLMGGGSSPIWPPTCARCRAAIAATFDRPDSDSKPAGSAGTPEETLP
jgi:hypothetical protein